MMISRKSIQRVQTSNRMQWNFNHCDHSICHMPFPISGLLELSLYSKRFQDITPQKC